MELAQNAADAALAAGAPGRLLLRLLDDPAGGPGTLLAANTGAPLDAAGVEGLATLRASAKGGGGDGADGTVGRFGVGFSAVLAVSDEPSVRSRAGGVRFSRDLTREAALAAGGALAGEVARRGGHVPALRLPFPADPGADLPPEGFDTVVVLPLRDPAARRAAEELLDACDDVLLVALPALAEVVVERPGAPARHLADAAARWHLLRRTGRHEGAALAGRGVEERTRLRFDVAWALPREGSGARPPGVVHAPTPTDDELPWPALLVATLPLGPDRRRVAPGPATDAVLDAAAAAYVDLLVERAAEGVAGADALALLPFGAAAGRVDAQLRERVLERARTAPLLRAVEEGAGEPGGPVAPLLLRPAGAVALTGPGADDPVLLAALAPSLAGLVAAPRALDRLLGELGVARLTLADALESLPPGRTPAGWRALYAALLPLAGDLAAREAMGALPVPLLDGRLVHGPRGLLLPGPAPEDPDELEALEDAAGVLAGYGLRLVHPDAAAGAGAELLERLGARAGGARVLLTDPAVVAAVSDSPDAEDPDAVADAVLAVVAAAVGTGPGAAERAEELARDLPALGDLALPDADDELAPASALVLPGTLAERALDPAAVAVVDADLLARWGPDVLRAVGVLRAPAAVHLPVLDPAGDDPDGGAGDPDDADDPAAGLDGLGAYADEVWGDVLDAEPGTVLEDVAVVRDLDLVVDAWPEVVAALAASPAGVEALTQPWRAGGRAREPHAAWWLRRRGPVPPVSRSAASPAWLPAAPPWTADLPAPVRRALGVLDAPADAGPADVLPLLGALAGARGPVPPADLLAVWSLLAVHADELPPAPPPERLRVLEGSGLSTVTVPAEEVVVPDDPLWAQLTRLGPRLLVPAAAAARVADVLDLDLASDRADGEPSRTGGEPHEVPGALAALLPGAPRTWQRVGDLAVDGRPVPVWVLGSGPDAVVLARDEAAAADGLAHAAGRWALRRAAAAVLLAPDAASADAVLASELPGL
ncbi:sacsin N-terminal ATP-binding-like domain-containing protein [Kineococcus sp. SYSU DK004]|uniref:sacsin N-terminal ATP-binding-like domain-containing protein n=1 Tax=Kineococcus sp. SYSU DK004 TaxID=3383125 RepID=UPI003D7E66A5